MAFSSAGIDDFSLLVDHTLDDFHRRGKFETVFDQTDGYPFIDRIFPANRVRKQSGPKCEFRFVLDGNGSFRWADLMEPRGSRDYSHNILKGEVEWANCDYECYIHEPTFARCRDEAELVDYMNLCMFEGKKSAIEGMEPSFIQSPADSDDSKFPQTIPAWLLGVTSGVTNYDGGFIGTNGYYEDGTVWTNGAGGLARDTESRFRNWAANHTGTFDATLVSSILKGRRLRGQRTPSMLKNIVGDRKPKLSLIMSQYMAHDYEEIVRTRFTDGENRDVAPQGIGNMSLGNVDIIDCAGLNDDALKTIYDINFAYIYPIVLRDRWHKRLPTKEDTSVDEMYIKRFKCSWQMLCDNPKLAGAKYHMPRS